jgi:hypothetical protein
MLDAWHGRPISTSPRWNVPPPGACPRGAGQRGAQRKRSQTYARAGGDLRAHRRSNGTSAGGRRGRNRVHAAGNFAALKLTHGDQCPLYPRKRTCAVQLGMSAKGQKRTSDRLFDHFVCAGEEGRRHQTYDVEISPLLVATIRRLPHRKIETTLPTPGTVSPRVTRNVPLGPSNTAVPFITSRSVQPSMVVGLVSGTGANFTEA